MKCCTACFDHPWLKELITGLPGAKGVCKFCGSRRKLVEVADLYSAFENALQLYSPLVAYETLMPGEDPLDVGDLLTQMLQDDWQVFSDKLIILEKEKDLLDAIMSSGWEKDSGTDPINVYDLYTRRDGFYRSSPFEKWQEFCEQVRQDPDSALPFGEFFTEELARLTETVAPSTTLYRSRRGYKIEEDSMVPYEAEKMSAPPMDLVTAGRANRKGKRVLYCSDEENTCISEVRPWHGAVISVCLIRPKNNLDIIDLTRAVEEPNPFIEESLRYELELAELLSGFGNELSTPLTRDDAEAEYFPSQRLSEFIEESGFRGMRYPSAMNPGGTNVVLFNPEDAEILDSKLVRVTSLMVEYEDE